jgi:hypothetical protein
MAGVLEETSNSGNILSWRVLTQLVSRSAANSRSCQSLGMDADTSTGQLRRGPRRARRGAPDHGLR